MNHHGSSFLVALSVTLLVPATVARAQEALRVLSARDTLRINAVGSPTLSSDGEWVLYTVRTRDMDDPELDEVTHIWRVRIDGTDNQQLTQGPTDARSPTWSPDGEIIAFRSARGDPRVLLEDIDRDFSTAIWSADGRRVFWSTGDGTSTVLFSVSIESGAVTSASVPAGRNSQWELSEDGTRWLWVHTDPDWPAEVYTTTQDGDPVRLTDANAWLRDEGIQLGTVETVRWENSTGEVVEGVLTKPVGYQDGRNYPFIVNPHGGPTTASLEAFNASNQFFAGNGYVVLQPNFRGSTNYGQVFLNANIDTWGITDYDDVMTGVDYAIAQGWADADRLICYGWSYGGYLSAWIVTQTDRFQAVSPGAGLTNLYSMYSTNDLQDYLASFFGGSPWTQADNYRAHSPITYVANVTSPVLLLHGVNDTRVPPEQSLELYRALKDLGKEVVFVRFPRENHGLVEPRHQMDRLRRYAEFFGEHVENPPISERQE